MSISNWAYLDTHTMFIALKGCMTGEEHKETALLKMPIKVTEAGWTLEGLHRGCEMSASLPRKSKR